MASVQRAIAIAPRLARGYATRGRSSATSSTCGAPWPTFERADALPGDDADALRIYAISLGQERRFDEGLQKIERARSLDPLNPVSFETEAVVFAYARRYRRSRSRRRAARCELSPERIQPRRILANVCCCREKTAEAEAEYGKLEPTDYRRLLGEAVLAARAGDRAAAMDNCAPCSSATAMPLTTNMAKFTRSLA